MPESPNSSTQPDSTATKTAAAALDLFRQSVSWHQLIEGYPLVELEIGSGKGLFLQSAASQRPDCIFVGVELSGKFANRAAVRIQKAGLPNVVVLRGDAQRFLNDMVPANSLARCHVYFPDPWWRNKHKKRRVLNEQAISNIHKALIAGGELHFWTDVLDYYEHICEQIMALTGLAGPRYVPQRTAQHPMDYTTHFERRARLHGQPVYRAVFTKPVDGLQALGSG